ncbi:hypothetical protein RHSIM_Rhsim04G0191100 [Rhododendron simsii]|uniref:Integrase catalytic domain-containing protein n=1 Tax=Rhododendron simsii TaxID=118357 RepID=A0A834H353_RHOSS|nr:hypothetical protein RHSIM_Rhsim04G0191100 [Rhododendron simsii]
MAENLLNTGPILAEGDGSSTQGGDATMEVLQAVRDGQNQMIAAMTALTEAITAALPRAPISTKWVEAVSLRRATGAAVANFIKENIICRFGIPKVILSDNGTPFINKNVKKLLKSYSVSHLTSTPYYPQGNGQAEATNKTLIRIISKLLDEKGGTWADHLALALWAYRTSHRKATRASPFSLVYGAETVLPAELSVPSARLALAAEFSCKGGKQYVGGNWRKVRHAAIISLTYALEI